MNAMQYFAGVDVGSATTKAVLVDIQGTLAAQTLLPSGGNLAAAAGHSVFLVEKNRLGSGTSSRSSKLIHGGLRYLESGQFRLVRESLRERALLLKNAPALVRPVSFYIPLYKETARRPWQIRLGLGLYAVLAGFDSFNFFRSVPPSEWAGLDGIRTEGLIKVFQYHDAATDDQALTTAVAHSAREFGALVEEQTSFLGAAREKNGYVVRLQSATGEKEIRCAALVNASGPWVNQVIGSVQPTVPLLPIDLVQGAHIILRGRPTRGVYYAEAPSDGRAVFIMPWQDHGLAGTTETIFQGDPDHVEALDADSGFVVESPEFFEEMTEAPEQGYRPKLIIPITKNSVGSLYAYIKNAGGLFYSKIYIDYANRVDRDHVEMRCGYWTNVTGERGLEFLPELASQYRRDKKAQRRTRVKREQLTSGGVVVPILGVEE